ncbi:MAG: hypothetical protein IAF02_15150 [Anaerolineae bacterium]|nr:hypothetical protein [Anaerolineae bacterium]
MSIVPNEYENPQARSDQFLKWLYEKTLTNPEFEISGFDEAWYEEFGKDAKRCFNSLKQRQFLLYEKSDANSYAYGRSSLPTAVGLNQKAIAYAEELIAPQTIVQPIVEAPQPNEPEPEKEPEIEKDVAWFIYNTTGNMRTALNYLEDARVYLNKETKVDRKEAEKEIREREELELEIVAKKAVGK